MPSAHPLIHVGFYKTASSWMQQFLFKQEYGFTVAMNPVEVQISLIEPRPFRFNPEQALGLYQGRLEGSDPLSTPVISVESLSGGLLNAGYDAKQNADRLRATFPEAKILLVTREQKSLLRSLYKSMVTWGNPFGISRLLEPLDYPQLHDFHLDFLRFDLLADHYCSLYGSENVLVLPYEMFQQTPRPFLKRLFEHCGMEYGDVLENPPPLLRRVNKNVSLSAIGYQRWLNRIDVALSGGPVSRFGDEEVVKRINRRMRNFPAIPYVDTYLEQRFATIVEERTRGEFAQSNQRLRRIMGLDPGRYGYEMPGG